LPLFQFLYVGSWHAACEYNACPSVCNLITQFKCLKWGTDPIAWFFKLSGFTSHADQLHITLVSSRFPYIQSISFYFLPYVYGAS
jgi:hypothetical protein